MQYLRSVIPSPSTGMAVGRDTAQRQFDNQETQTLCFNADSISKHGDCAAMLGCYPASNLTRRTLAALPSRRT
ncbi:MAG: hypothetical protein ACK56I_01505, partial [bacterium]